MVDILNEVIVGSIPACAGEPHTVPVGLPVSLVYPRVCGGAEILNVIC